MKATTTVDDSQLPTHHVLRPHHVSICIVFMLIFPKKPLMKLSSRYMLHVLRVLLNEVAEMTDPKPFREFLRDLGNERETPGYPEGAKLVQKVQHLATMLNDIDVVTDFINDLPCLVSDEDDSSSAFVSNFYSAFMNTCLTRPVESQVTLWTPLQAAWVNGDNYAGYQKYRRDAIRDDNYIIRLQQDREPYAEAEPYGRFEKEQAVGDEQAASENLRRFFEQKFGDASDSELRQHALLNIARMHIKKGNYEPARNVIREAVTVSRTGRESVILMQCMTLLRRLEGRTYARKEPLNELQVNIPPLEILYDVTKLMREGQPLSDCFERMVEAMSVYELSRDTRGGPPSYKDQFAFHAVQGYIWRLAGCEKLAEIEENIVLAFTEYGGNDDMRLKVIAYRAQAFARAGKEDECFKLLLDPQTWKGLEHNMHQLHCWVMEIWYNMLLLASRRGQTRQINDFIKPHRPGPVPSWKPFVFLPVMEKDKRTTWYGSDPYVIGDVGNTGIEDPRSEQNIEEHLYKVLQMRKVDHSINSLDHLLKALWQSEYQGRFRLYRLSMVLLADLGLEFGMTVRSKRLVEEVMPQIINGDDLELRAFACFTLGRCTIACAKRDRILAEALLTALPYLQLAENDYRAIQIPAAIQDVLYITSVLYNTLANIAAKSNAPNLVLQVEYTRERDAAAERHAQAVEDGKKLEMVTVTEGWDEMWRTVSMVATKTASRRLFYEKE